MRYLYSMSHPPGSWPTPSHIGYRDGSVRSSNALSGSQYPSASQPPVTHTSHPNFVSACSLNVTGDVDVRLENVFHVSNVFAYAGEDMGPPGPLSASTIAPPLYACIALPRPRTLLTARPHSAQPAATRGEQRRCAASPAVPSTPTRCEAHGSLSLLHMPFACRAAPLPCRAACADPNPPGPRPPFEFGKPEPSHRPHVGARWWRDSLGSSSISAGRHHGVPACVARCRSGTGSCSGPPAPRVAAAPQAHAEHGRWWSRPMVRPRRRSRRSCRRAAPFPPSAPRRGSLAPRSPATGRRQPLSSLNVERSRFFCFFWREGILPHGTRTGTVDSHAGQDDEDRCVHNREGGDAGRCTAMRTVGTLGPVAPRVVLREPA